MSIAARQFRECGIDGASIADLMKEAGLTHGGFYKHFTSRDELVLEAMQHAFDSSARQQGSGAPKGKLTFTSLVEAYLSPRHRDHPGTGCAVAALVGDVGRAGKSVRNAYTQQVRGNIEALRHLSGADEDVDGRRESIVALCVMAGALGLARAVDDDALSREVLESARQFLLDEFHEEAPPPAAGRRKG
ncbi:TetR/AcrR family transcriptional regulator [Cupriavidus sp. RAF12]|uniref:TetR/AcrR family transcriptional regulator n=1 Tax=Cupriavidus sp. RAF12 TaxID=3233050 RepID=UPI003F8E84D2